ncbi:MAG: hypothetical protein E6I81_14470 [Chloroflexi bacterium]|nr:MAG: hypothetical protein E6I81_14470 [Chloroflexota bacterium]
MATWFRKRAGGAQASWLVSALVTGVCLTTALALSGTRSKAYTAYSLAVHKTAAIPPFARKYGLPCSACHTAWPELNAFGQTFKDNGYQLMNDRDSPIWQSPAYFPLGLRTTPHFNFESTTKQVVDSTPGVAGPPFAEKTLTQSGFDLSGIDFLMLGTLYKNVTFGLVPTLDPDGTAGVETAFVRFDNLGGSPWANVKLGKFELDNLLSEKRIVLLSNNGGLYQNYHFIPLSDGTNFELGANQIGLELMGHSLNSYTRYSLAVLTGTNGDPGLGAGSTYDAAFTLSHAFDAGSMGVERLGVYGYVGQRPTVFQTTGGTPIAASAGTRKPFYRVGVTGNFSFGKLELLPFLMHGFDDKALTAGTNNATWNGGLLEAHYIVDPQLLLIGRYETIRMSQQADPATPSDQGNIDGFSFGIRRYAFMFSRAGLALHGEYSLTKTIGNLPQSGDGIGPPLTPGTAVWSSSLLLGLDFAF